MDAQRSIYPQRVRKKSVGQIHGGPRTSMKSRTLQYENQMTAQLHSLLSSDAVVLSTGEAD